MFNIIDGELRKYLEEITERDVTPEGADEYLSHEHYHSFLKGCDCEIVLKNIKRNGNFPNETVMVNKYCKTHKVMCSKTGWELGWNQGTKSTLDCYCLNCGRIIDHATYCKKCGNILACFRDYLHRQLYGIIGRKEFIYYGKLDKIKMNMLDYMKGIYLEKQRKVEKEDEGRYELLIHLIELNIKEKIKRIL